MGTVYDILHAIFPDRDEFCEDEVSRVISAMRMPGEVSPKTVVRRPMRFVPVGEVVTVRNVRYRCVERPEVHHRDCCSGCAFVGSTCPPYLQCSKFDRRDRRFIWFVREDSRWWTD